MQSQLVHSNFVVAARQFNPSIFSQLWLVKHEIASEKDFEGGESICTPAVVQLRSPRFVLMVLPDQLQLAPLPVQEAHSELIADMIGKIVQKLPETPYVAVGINFHWTMEADPDEFVAFSRAIFYRENALYNQFAEQDARFGGYLSKDILGTRLRLDVKPTKTGTGDEEVERFLFAFNFQIDLGSDNAVSEIQRMANQWNAAKDHAAEIIHVLEN